MTNLSATIGGVVVDVEEYCVGNVAIHVKGRTVWFCPLSEGWHATLLVVAAVGAVVDSSTEDVLAAQAMFDSLQGAQNLHKGKQNGDH